MPPPIRLALEFSNNFVYRPEILPVTFVLCVFNCAYTGFVGMPVLSVAFLLPCCT